MDSNTRQRMRPWLEAKVEAGNIAGLHWINKSKKIFRVPWKHGGKHDWSEGDSQIFKEWAIHTGRFREGVDTPDWPVWKTRFRCALNKLPDIDELREHSRLEGTDPYRAYKFLNKDEVEVKKKKKENANGDTSIKHVDLIAVEPTPGASNVMPNIVPAIPILPSDLYDITVEPLKSDSQGDNRNIIIKDEDQEDMDTSDIVTGVTQDTEMYMDNMEVKYPDSSDDVIYFERGVRQPQFHTTQLNNFSENNVKEQPDNAMHIKLRYCQHEVASFEVSNNYGCRLFYAGQQGDQIRGDISGMQDAHAIFGSPDLQQLNFPPIQQSYNQQQQEHTMQLLNALDRGLILESENGCIYATRKSRCVIFIATPINGGEPFKLQRDEKTLVFDYKKNFHPRLLQYFINHDKPWPYFLIGFGQKINTPNLSNSNLLISAVVYHTQSLQMLNQVCCSSPLSPPIQMSRSDEFDKFLHHLREVQKVPNFLVAK